MAYITSTIVMVICCFCRVFSLCSIVAVIPEMPHYFLQVSLGHQELQALQAHPDRQEQEVCNCKLSSMIYFSN